MRIEASALSWAKGAAEAASRLFEREGGWASEIGEAVLRHRRRGRADVRLFGRGGSFLPAKREAGIRSGLLDAADALSPVLFSDPAHSWIEEAALRSLGDGTLWASFLGVGRRVLFPARLEGDGFGAAALRDGLLRITGGVPDGADLRFPFGRAAGDPHAEAAWDEGPGPSAHEALEMEILRAEFGSGGRSALFQAFGRRSGWASFSVREGAAFLSCAAFRTSPAGEIPDAWIRLSP